MNSDRESGTESTMLFFDLLVMLRNIVRMQLGQMADPQSGDCNVNVEAARHFVDMIGALKEKTEGNLNEQESQVLDNLLSELKMACVKAGERAETEGKKEEEGDDNCETPKSENPGEDETQD